MTHVRSAPRSANGLTWATDAEAAGRELFQAHWLGDLATEKFRRIGTRVRPMGAALGRGLTEKAARELGLRAGTAVGVGIIDAHAGGIGTLGAGLRSGAMGASTLERRVALIGGTSSCHMAVSARPRFIPGIWGPYFSAMVPGLWLTEGGQSATVALIDHVIYSHRAAAALSAEAKRKGRHDLRTAQRPSGCPGKNTRRQIPRGTDAVTCTCSRIFTATVRRAPIPRCVAP